MNHWAHQYIGRPYTDEQNCWALCREVFRDHYGIKLPEIGESGNTYIVKHAADSQRLRPCFHDAKPREGDLCVMRSPLRLHAGIVVRANRQIGVLHSTRDTGVIWQPYQEATEGMTVQLWRRHD